MVTRDELIEQYKLKHERESGYGAGECWHKVVLEFLRATESKTVLDYGCGKGGLVRALRREKIVADGYDPAIPEFARPASRKFDAVTCLDVMEHLRKKDVSATFEEIEGRARKAVFFSIATRPAIHTLPNGRNCHETVKPFFWWEQKLREVFPREEWSAVVNDALGSSQWNIGLRRV